MKNKIWKILAKFTLRIHNFSYKAVARFAIKAENGLHPKHRLTRYHQFFINNVFPSDVILDIGCGNGALSYDVAKKAKKVVGIDISKQSVEIAEKKYSAPNIEYRVGDVTKDLPNQRFDVIILSNVLEHIEYRVGFLNKIKNLAPKILIRVPIIDRDWITLYKKELGIEWRLDETHYIEYTLKGFQQELQKAGLKIERFSVQFGEIWAVVK